MQLHGSIGASDETALMTMWANIPELGMVDGPTEVHKVTVARTVLREYDPAEGVFPSYHTTTAREQAMKKYGHLLPDE